MDSLLRPPCPPPQQLSHDSITSWRNHCTTTTQSQFPGLCVGCSTIHHSSSCAHLLAPVRASGLVPMAPVQQMPSAWGPQQQRQQPSALALLPEHQQDLLQQLQHRHQHQDCAGSLPRLCPAALVAEAPVHPLTAAVAGGFELGALPRAVRVGQVRPLLPNCRPSLAPARRRKFQRSVTYVWCLLCDVWCARDNVRMPAAAGSTHSL